MQDISRSLSPGSTPGMPRVEIDFVLYLYLIISYLIATA